MTQKYTFVGNYKIQGSYLISNTLKLLISKRKQTTPTKPLYFILDKTNTNSTYISSLYLITDNQYKFDYKGANYLITYKDSNTAEINLMS